MFNLVCFSTKSFTALVLGLLLLAPGALAVPPMADYWSLRKHPDHLKPPSPSRQWGASQAERAGESQADYPTFRSVGRVSVPSHRTRELLRQVAFLEDSLKSNHVSQSHPQHRAVFLALRTVRDELVREGAHAGARTRVDRMKKFVDHFLRKE